MRLLGILPLLLFVFTLSGQNAYYDAQLFAGNADYYKARIQALEKSNITLTSAEKDVLNTFSAFFNNPFLSTINSTDLNVSTLQMLLSKHLTTLYAKAEYRIDNTTNKGYLLYQGKEYPIYNRTTGQITPNNNLPFKLIDSNKRRIKANTTAFKNLFVQNNDIYNLQTGRLVAIYNSTTRKAVNPATGTVFSEFNTVLEYQNADTREGLGVSTGNPIAQASSFTTQIVDATAQFLVERAQEELLLAFIDRLRTDLNANKEFTTLFSKTTSLLNSNDIFHVPTMGPVWQAAFNEDLQALIPSFRRLIKTDPYYARYKNDPGFKLFMVTYDAMQLNSEGNNLLEIIDHLSSDVATKGSTDFVDESLRMLHILSKNLTNHQGTGLITLDSLKSFSPEDAKYFTALIYQQNKSFFNSIRVDQTNINSISINKANLKTSLGALLRTDIKPFIQLAESFAGLGDQFQTAYTTYNVRLSNAEITDYNTDYLQFANLITKFLDLGFETRYFNDQSAYYNSPYYTTYRPILTNTVEAYQASFTKNYGQIVLHSMLAFEPLMKVKVANMDTTIAKLMVQKRTLSGQKLTANSTELKKLQRNRSFLNDFSKNFLFYGSFMVDVLSSNDANDMKGILDKYAAPVGSYIAKRKGVFNVDLNAYPGLYGGYETQSQSQNGTDEYGFVTGVTAPIGLSLTWGNSLLFVKADGYSTSIFMPLVDIGAAFSYRWGNQSEGFPQEITLKQIFSPGAYLAFGFKNLPIALNVGAQYTPELRTIGQADAYSTIRFGVNVAVDISIFSLYSKVK